MILAITTATKERKYAAEYYFDLLWCRMNIMNPSENTTHTQIKHTIPKLEGSFIGASPS